jgi:hypothetical protein
MVLRNHYYKNQMDALQQASYKHTIAVLRGSIKVVFYDSTTLYFESEEPDELSKTDLLFVLTRYIKKPKNNSRLVN